ncbi:Ribonuclease H [Abeliophyllum distichum]|uniref:Ribonuclease H n=1 Tax=Abeliophyllum distichum TaxID=126358 RepID=A0ABD1RG58_9LAMI
MMLCDIEMAEASEATPDDITMEELENFPVDPNDPTRKLQVGKDLLEEPKEALKRFIWENLDVFTWKHEDMIGIDPKACPKDSFPLPQNDQLVDATSRHELLSFINTYSGYNQISMYLSDEEHTLFVTYKGLYCYKVMSFGLKTPGLNTRGSSTRSLPTSLARS